MTGRTYFDSLRRRARERAPAVLKKHGTQCWWCKAPLISIQSLRPEQIVRITGRHVWWRKNGTVRVDLFATLDHVVPLSEGGTNRFANLVPACSKCNNSRNKEQLCNTPIEADQKRICPKCGRPKPASRRHCKICRYGQPWLHDRHARTRLGPLLNEALRNSGPAAQGGDRNVP